MKMNQAVKQEWVADLRSGDIIKNKFSLRRGSNRMCVLGVLCNVHAKHHPEIASTQKKMNEYMGQSTNLPKEVAKWAGLEQNDNPRVMHKGFKLSLMSLNDDDGLTFKTLANLIEAQL